MHLSPQSLRQIDDYLQSLEVEALCGLSMRLLADLKEAWDRLNQGPDHSSRPPSSRAPWERTGSLLESEEAPEAPDRDRQPAEAQPAEAKPAEVKPTEAKPTEAKPPRKPGKQPGALGIGHIQVFQANADQAHYPDTGAGCGRPLAGAGAYTGFQAVDLRGDDPARPRLTLWVVDHRYYEIACPCGHRTRAVARQGVVDPLLAGIELSEWRRVGAGAGGADRGAGPAVPAVAGADSGVPGRVAGPEPEHRDDPSNDPRSQRGGSASGSGVGRGGAGQRAVARR